MKVKKAVIPAAGLGTRMLPSTKTIPKEMLPVVDKPSIQYIVEEAVASGIEDILIVTNRAKSAMDDYFDYYPELEDRLSASGKDSDLEKVRGVADMANVFYVRQKETKGLGHAIWRAKNFIGDQPFAVLLGDDIMYSDAPVTRQLTDVYEATGCPTVGVKSVSDEAIGKYCSLDVAPMRDNLYAIKSLIEKPTPEQVMSNFAILGRYVLTPAIFDILENLPAGYGGEIQLTDGLNVLCQQEKMIACEFEGKRYDSGNIFGYLEVVIDMALKRDDIAPWLRDFLKSKVSEF